MRHRFHTSTGLALPEGLQELIVNDMWPRGETDISSTVSKVLLHKFAPDEDYLHFDTPPFYTIQEYIERDGPEFWNDFATPNELDFKLA